jgi:signal transduction histidine kinase
LNRLLDTVLSLLPCNESRLVIFDSVTREVLSEATRCRSDSNSSPPMDPAIIFKLSKLADKSAIISPNPDGNTVLYLPLQLEENLYSVVTAVFREEWRPSPEEKTSLSSIALLSGCAIFTVLELERRQAQYDELVIQTEKLTALGRMAAGIAHEINNPLTGILLFSSSMANKMPVDDPRRESLDIIIEETIRCRSILKDLLEFSRGSKPRKELSDPNSVIGKAVSITENEFRIRRVRLDYNVDPSLPEILVDSSQIEQVLINLLINSAEATAANGRVFVKGHVDPFKNTFLIEVSDTGCGIPSENIDKIFEPFFSTKDKGTGLGLAVSYGIVLNHGGKLRYSKPSGWSTRFTIELPLQPPA